MTWCTSRAPADRGTTPYTDTHTRQTLVSTGLEALTLSPLAVCRALLELKTCVQGLLRALVPAPAISAQPLPTPPPPLTRSKSTQHLDSDRPVVELPWTGGGAEEGLGGQVVMAVEQAVFLGARRQEFKGVLPFMRMLHTIVHEHPWRVPVSAQLRASYGTTGLRFPAHAMLSHSSLTLILGWRLWRHLYLSFQSPASC